MNRVQDPHNVEAEQAFLGSIELDPTSISRASRLVRPADFSIERHSAIFQAMLDLDLAGIPIDKITLAEQLGGQFDDVGGFYYLAQLETDAPSAVGMDFYAGIIRKYARLRRLIAGAGRIVRLAHRTGATPDEALALAEATLLSLVKEERLASVRPLGDLVHAYLDKVQTVGAGNLGLSTGLASLDALSGRLQPADLVLLAGEPGTLKTALVLKIARNIGRAGRKVALFSLESSNAQVVQRLLASETGITAQALRLGDVKSQWPELLAAGTRLAELGMYIDDTPGLMVTELRSKARWLHYLWTLDLIVINYLQLLRSDQRLGSREQDLAAISRALKALARELRLPLLAVSILESTTDGKPGLHQLNPVQYEADVIWLCQKVNDHLLITQTRWRDGPAGASIEIPLEVLWLKTQNNLITNATPTTPKTSG